MTEDGEMTAAEIEDRLQEAALDDYKEQSCELGFALREAALKWYDFHVGERSVSVYTQGRGLKILAALDLTHDDYREWKNPTPSGAPF